MTTPQQGSSTGSARIFSIIGAVFDVVALVLFPIVFGPIGAVLGFVAYSKGDKPLGLWVGIGGIVATIVGMVLAAAVINAN
jgi:hypothetical protein